LGLKLDSWLAKSSKIRRILKEENNLIVDTTRTVDNDIVNAGQAAPRLRPRSTKLLKIILPLLPYIKPDIEDCENAIIKYENERAEAREANKKIKQRKKIQEYIGNSVFTDILNGVEGHIYSLTEKNNVFMVEAQNGLKRILKTYNFASAEKFEHENVRNEFDNTVKVAEVSPYVAKGLGFCGKEINGITFIESLYEYGGIPLSTYAGKIVKPKLIFKWMRESLAGFAAAAEKAIFHSDIKPENMVYDGKQTRIIDFGSSINLDSKQKLFEATNVQAKQWTECYSAPELFKYKYERSMAAFQEDLKINDPMIIHGKADVYSWGMSFYQIITRKTCAQLFSECVKYKIGDSKKYKPFLDSIEEYAYLYQSEIINLLNYALKFDINDRPTFGFLYDMIKDFDKKV